MLPHAPVRLKDGDFFGEMALLTRQKRNADVVAVSYCELLVLRKQDLDALSARHPALRAQIEAHAAARRGAPARQG